MKPIDGASPTCSCAIYTCYTHTPQTHTHTLKDLCFLLVAVATETEESQNMDI